MKPLSGSLPAPLRGAVNGAVRHESFCSEPPGAVARRTIATTDHQYLFWFGVGASELGGHWVGN